MSNKNIQLYLGDSKEVLKQIPDNSVDLICTDPPYGYSFMGKDWDKVVIPSSHWKECLRVLKPGAFAFVMSAPRQDVLSRMIYNLQEAGFETGFSSIYWTYATGFPKASNISKLIDKQECKKQLTEKLGRKPTKKEFEKEWENFRKIIRENSNSRPNFNGKTIDMNFGGRKYNNPITEAISPQAKELDGSYSGFQPKPAVEIIIVAMKPLSEKTYVDQALKNGKGVTHLDNCRIPYESEEDKSQATPQGKVIRKNFAPGQGLKGEETNRPPQIGRFPANLIVSDDVLNDGKIRKVGKLSPGMGKGYHKDKGTSFGCGCDPKKDYGGDSGSYSRYFDLDKWWIERVKKLPPEVQKVFPYLIVPKASKSEKNKGCEEFQIKQTKGGGGGIGDYLEDVNSASGKYGSEKAPAKNNHPTVKPIKLFSYLITLGSREGDVVLDPFMGSGTTGIAAKLLDRKFIGIEMSEEYIKIASERIKAWNNKEDKNNG